MYRSEQYYFLYTIYDALVTRCVYNID
eukprot:SAG31_NODE_8985_length_1353_cov_0.949761_2_plen_26_part_01